MKTGQESQTAVWVCMARAMAHDRTPVTRFSDPTALVLLPEDARAQVEKARSKDPPASLGERMTREVLAGRTGMMVARTVEIDDAIRAAPCPQVVILGAGLDGRAWRMPELHDSVVFEVDHPDSQRRKRERAGALIRAAREIRFVPVDFTRDRLDHALAGAGHDVASPTIWVWEGVVMYLSPADVEATLVVIDRRSAPASRLIVAYTRPTVMTHLIRPFVRRVGEPFRSSFKPGALRALLARYGFTVARDENVPTIAQALSPDLARATRMIRHLRIATADRATTGDP